MPLVRRRELEGDDLLSQVRRRIRDIDQEIERLDNQRDALKRRAKELEKAQSARTKKARRVAPASGGVACPRCGRDHDFLTDADGFLAHVLEEPEDTELLTPGKPLFCPACGDVFLYEPKES